MIINFIEKWNNNVCSSITVVPGSIDGMFDDDGIKEFKKWFLYGVNNALAIPAVFGMADYADIVAFGEDHLARISAAIVDDYDVADVLRLLRARASDDGARCWSPY